jgi:MFS family permease
MYSAAAAWLMTTLDPHPVMVSLVQVATSLPLVLFAIPAGALTDIVDKRRFLIAIEVGVFVTALVFATLVTLGRVTPVLLLAFMFLVSIGSALDAPGWQSIVTQLVPRDDLAGAVAANSLGINISRAIGPALSGAITLAWGIAAPFWIDAFSNLATIGALTWWRPPAAAPRRLPAERFMSAMSTGIRYARNNPALRATLVRAVAFFLFASAYWALLPLVVRTQIAAGAGVYGLLLGAIGGGAVGGAFLLPRLKARLGADRMVAGGTAGTAVALVLFGLAHEPVTALIASLVAGACWIATLSSLNVSAQLALPEWVRGRGLAIYVTTFFTAMTVGSIVWGEVAALAGVSAAHIAAAGGALLGIAVTRHARLQTGAEPDLAPSMHWPAPVVAEDLEPQAGPVMVLVEYHIADKDRVPFLAALEAVAAERRRDGAYAGGVFEDTASPGRLVEAFVVESWLEHLRQHDRVTNADRVRQEQVDRFLLRPASITHLVNAGALGPPSAPPGS